MDSSANGQPVLQHLVRQAILHLWAQNAGKALTEALRANPPDDDWGSEVRRLRESMGLVTGPRTTDPRYIIAATGTSSRVARRASNEHGI